MQVDEDGSKEIEFQEFVHAIQINKAMSEKTGDEQETLDAWMALGGNVSAPPTPRFMPSQLCSCPALYTHTCDGAVQITTCWCWVC